MRRVDTQEYLTILKDLVQQGKEVSLLVSGNSMSPFLIHERDYVYFRKPNRPLKPGDIVFFQRKTGQYIMHRIWKVKPEGLYIVGDAQTVIEGPVAEAQVFAVITRVQRKGKWISPGDFWWEFFEHVWIHIIPFRHVMMRIYAGIRRQGSCDGGL